MAWMRRGYQVAIDDDRRILHPSCAGGFCVGLHDQFRERSAVVESRHATTCYNLGAGCQHRSPADTSNDTASRVDVLYAMVTRGSSASKAGLLAPPGTRIPT